MNRMSDFRLLDGEAPPPADAPKVLTRTIQAPAGLPWDQYRAADLEARHGAPLPIGEIVYRLQRLEPWRPGAAARYGAFYVLARELTGRLDTTVELEGEQRQVTFLPPGLQLRQARGFAVLVLMAAAMAFAVTASLGTAFVRRGEAEASLSALETRAIAKTRVVEARRRVQRQNEALDAQPDRGGRLRDAIEDLAWASAAKAPEARIEAVHWEPGLLAIEARGSQPPLVTGDGRSLRKAPRPLRRGVWLWGVTLPSEGAAGLAPAAALPLDGPWSAPNGR
jgi:hypothetical protein